MGGTVGELILERKLGEAPTPRPPQNNLPHRFSRNQAALPEGHDYLTMLGKLGLAAIRPGSAYFSAATGPVVGARLMLQGNVNHDLSVAELDRRVGLMAQQLGVGMQEMEDSLCNWQKSPDHYVRFLA